MVKNFGYNQYNYVRVLVSMRLKRWRISQEIRMQKIWIFILCINDKLCRYEFTVHAQFSEYLG